MSPLEPLSKPDVFSWLPFFPASGIWTIHGIWPTKRHEVGPSYCREDVPFRPSALEAIEDELDARWTNVHANVDKYSFWRHEWEKHGTCAMQLAPMSTEVKYFEQGERRQNVSPAHS